MIIPFLIAIFNYYLKESIKLSYILIFGGAFGNLTRFKINLKIILLCKLIIYIGLQISYF